jgi:glyoxylase-like metal-dependent hydrolase (beta-lactamase superfamily II)
VVFDAPPSFGERLRAAIEVSAPGVPITHFVQSHKHADHNGGGYTFADIEGLTVIAAAGLRREPAETPLRGVLTPTETFEETLSSPSAACRSSFGRRTFTPTTWM